MQVIILGMHRSGTSLTSRLINMMGAYFGPEGASIGFSEHNPRGYWERKDVVRLNDDLLKHRGCTWNHVADGQLGGEAPIPEELRRNMRGLILELDAHRPWFLKDPRLCLTLPDWMPLLEVPVCLIVYRDPLEISLSLVQRDDHSAEYGIPSLKYGLALWEFYMVSSMNASADLPRIFVAHGDFLANPVAAVHHLYNSLIQHDVRGLRLPSDREILAFIDRKLYRARAERLETLPLSESQHALTEVLQGVRDQRTAMAVSCESRTLLRDGPSAAQ